MSLILQANRHFCSGVTSFDDARSGSYRRNVRRFLGVLLRCREWIVSMTRMALNSPRCFIHFVGPQLER